MSLFQATSSLSGLWALFLTMAIVLVRHFRWVSSFWISVQIDSVQSINRIFSDFCLNCVWLTSQKIKILSIFIEYHSVYPTTNLQIILQLLQMLIQKTFIWLSSSYTAYHEIIITSKWWSASFFFYIKMKFERKNPVNNLTLN